ncbi:hypothetical protein G9A89_022010 [Geosiphon pyriformis]|nr:hypothetical protein G9A89_022010 [Geosiphon pyriformis]
MSESEEIPVLYSYYRSSCSWRIRISLNYKDIKYETRPIDITKGEQKTPEYTLINPYQEVPALIIGGFTLTQSVAILEYLEEIYPDKPLLPKNPIDRAMVRSLVQFIVSDIQPIQNLRVMKRVNQDDWNHYWILTGLTALEKQLTKTAGQYCFGDQLTLADLCLVPQVFNARRFQVDLSQFPIIERIDARLNKLTPFHDAHPSNQIDYPGET